MSSPAPRRMAKTRAWRRPWAKRSIEMWTAKVVAVVLAVVLAGAALGCQGGGEGVASGRVEVRDSAGVRIVENAPPADDARLPWTIGPEPLVTIGVVEGDDPYMLSQVTDAARLPDGRIVIANLGTNELRVFDATGRWLASWGGAGEGPGEFQGLLAVERWPGDSIAAWYGPRRGVSIFDDEGNFGRSVVLERDSGDPLAVAIRPIAARRDGTILAGHDTHQTDPVTVEIRDAEGRLAGSLGEHAGHERHLVENRGDFVRAYEPVFGAKAVQLAWGDLVVHSLNNRNEIRAFAGDGTLARIVRWGELPPEPTREQIEAWIEERVCEYPSWVTPEEIEDYTAQRRREYMSVPVAERLPAFAAAIVDRLGHLWVEDYLVPGDCGPEPGTPWTVFDPEGLLLGRVALPAAGREIFEIGADYILVLAWDDLGVERVEMWGVERR